MVRRLVPFVIAMTWLVASSFLATAQSVDFDTSRLPSPPTTFEEQKLWDDVTTARKYPNLAAAAHEKLAAYYEQRGLADLAAKERAAAGGGSAVAQPAPVAPPAQRAQVPDALAAGPTDDLTDPNVFDLSAFPPRPASFDEQLILETLRDPNTLASPGLLALAHRQLARYYAALGRADLAGTEYGRAIVASPTDPRGFQGLAAVHEAVGTDAGDGNVALRDVAGALQDAGYLPDEPAEPEPVVSPSANVGTNSGQWQEVSGEFNRRMNYLYTSNAWSSVSRTVFTNLYGGR